jgi:hypothetical protein
MSDEPTGPAERWRVSLDLRDVIGGCGVLAMLVGAAAFHWGLALLLLGTAATAYALIKAR